MKKQDSNPVAKGIRTRRLEIRPFVASDYTAWRESHLAVKEKQNAFDAGPLDPKHLTRAQFKHLLATKGGGISEIYHFGIFDRRTGRLLGFTDIAVLIRWIFQWGNLGFYLHNFAWGKGYGAEAAKATLRIAFEQLGLNRIEASTILKNRPSIRVMKSIGMKRECIRKRFMRGKDGHWQDMVVYASVGKSATSKRQK